LGGISLDRRGLAATLCNSSLSIVNFQLSMAAGRINPAHPVQLFSFSQAGAGRIGPDSADFLLLNSSFLILHFPI
jgi:hypothetical protein